MKLGFITAIREDFELPMESMAKRFMTNLGPMYLAAYLKKKGIEVEVIIKDTLEELARFKPEILGISSVTENYEFAKVLAQRAKELWNPIVVLGGAHITVLPQSLSKEFDIGVVGEGEEPICDLVQHINRNRRLVTEELVKIPGFVFHTPSGLCQTGIRKGVNPIDDIPHPAREKYVKSPGITYMMTSRGCPYTCNFCVIPSISEGYRKHSPEYVIAEIRSIKDYFPTIKHIRFFDDLYIVDRKRVAQIADRVDAEGLNKDLSFGCWGRANLIDKEVIKAFQRMNMYYVAFGAESGSSRVMSKIKPGSSVEENQRAIDLLHDQGINVSCSFILGHPFETEDDLWATFEFIEKNFDKLFEVEFNVAVPWPGTELWNYAKERGLVHETMDFGILKECGFFPTYTTEGHPYLNEKISPDRFEDILDEFKRLYFKMVRRLKSARAFEAVNPTQDIARLY